MLDECSGYVHLGVGLGVMGLEFMRKAAVVFSRAVVQWIAVCCLKDRHPASPESRRRLRALRMRLLAVTARLLWSLMTECDKRLCRSEAVKSCELQLGSLLLKTRCGAIAITRAGATVGNLASTTSPTRCDTTQHAASISFHA